MTRAPWGPRPAPASAAPSPADTPAEPAPSAPEPSSAVPAPGRRRFLKLAAATSAAALALPAARTARAATRRVRPAPRPAPPPAAPPVSGSGRTADPRELEKLKGYLADSLKAVREFPLPPGSDLAFTFRPLRGARARRGR